MKSKNTKRLLIAAAVIAFIAAILLTQSDWQGTDDSVIGPLAEQAGVEEKTLLPWSIEGDLELFVFCAGGAIAGFIGGYLWKTLFPGRPAATPGRSSGTANEGGRDGAGAGAR